MRIVSLMEKIFFLSTNYCIWRISPASNTRWIIRYFRRKGMHINGLPNYLAGNINWDGSDYSLIELNEGCTISGRVTFLCHDWSPTTAARGLGMTISPDNPVGVRGGIRVGRYAFVGVGAILLPNTDIGDGAIVGAGAVVKGKVAPHTIVVGNPCRAIGSTMEYIKRHIEKAMVS